MPSRDDKSPHLPRGGVTVQAPIWRRFSRLRPWKKKSKRDHARMLLGVEPLESRLLLSHACPLNDDGNPIVNPVDCPSAFSSKAQTVDALQWWEDKTGNGLTADDTLHPDYYWRLFLTAVDARTMERLGDLGEVVIPNGGATWAGGVCWTTIVAHNPNEPGNFWGCSPAVGFGIYPPRGRWLSTDSVDSDNDYVAFNQPSIAGFVFDDTNGNGRQDTGELGAPYIRVELASDDQLCPTGYCGYGDDAGTTDQAGNFLIRDVGPRAGVAFPLAVSPDYSDYIQTTPSPELFIRSGEHIVDQKLGTFRRVSVSGRVFDDRNGNGVQDTGESVRVGTRVFLDVNGDRIRNSGEPATSSGADGQYSLTGLGPGVVLAEPGSPAQLFSITTATGNPYATASGANVTTAALGVFRHVTLYGQVFGDQNGDGIRDHQGDPFLADVTVQLDLNDDGVVDRTAVTNSIGYYEFSYVGPGRHRVSPVLREDQTLTTPPESGGYLIQTESGQAVDPLLFGVADVPALVVNSTQTRSDESPGDKKCDTGETVDGVAECTLWAAIQESNAAAGRQRIAFASTIRVIDVTTPLPEVTDAVKFLGGAGRVVLLGNTAGNGLTIAGGNSVIVGLVLAGFSGAGIELKTKGGNVIEDNELIGNERGVVIQEGSIGNTIRKNHIGTDENYADRGNERAGIAIRSESNVIGGDRPEDGNLIAYNSSGVELHVGFNRITHNVVAANRQHGVHLLGGHNRVQSNRIGLDREDRPLGNAGAGIVVTSDENIIGGYEADNGNLIAFNQRGVEFDQAPYNTLAGNTIFANLGEGVLLRRGSDDNTLQANQIGLDLDGRHRGNGNAGIWIAGSNNQVGGVRAGDGNTVAFNGPRTGADLGLNQHAGFGIVVALWPGDPPLNNAEIAGNAILGNGSYLNGGPGIDLGSDGWTGNDTGSIGVTPDADTGPNTLQNAPGLELVPAEQKILGRLYSRPETRYRIEFFASPLADALLRNEGQRFLGAIEVTTDVTGAASFVAPSLAFTNQEGVTATASPYRGDGLLAGTSEFSRLAEENPDSCARIDLQRLKQETWQAAVQRIEIITADDRAASQHLRALANKSLGPDRDGCIRASLDALNAFHGLLNAHSTLQSESGWWTDFQELLGNDLERLGTLDDGLWDEIVTLYDAAPSWDEAWDGIARVADDRDYRNQLIWELDTSVRTTFADWSQSLENGVVWLGRHGQEALFDGVVRLVDSITWDNLTEGLYAFADLFRKAFDPDVPVESRIGNFLAGYLTVTGVVEAGVTLGGAALTVARSRALVSRFGAQMIDDLNANILLQNRVSAQMASASQRAAGLRARGQVGVYRLRPGDAITDDLLWSTGYSAEQASRLREIARGRYTLRFRPTNPDSARWIRQGALPKPVTLKNKTVSELDLYLGFRSEDLGLVGLRGPADLINPLDLDACRQQRSGFCQQLIRRYEQRVAEFREISLPAEFRADAHGVVRHVDGRGVAGDIDPIDFFHPDGSRVVGADREALMAELREAGIQHSGEVYFKTDIITGMRQTCVTNPPKCVTEGSEEWLAKLNKVDEFMEGQRRAYFSREEIAIEFGVDGEMRAGVVNVLPDIIDGEGEGENSLGYDLPTRAQVEYLLGRLHIDIRRDQLTNIGAVTGAVRDQLFAQVDRFDELLRQELPDVGITFADFDHLSAAELVAIVNRETKGLHIDPAEPLSGEGEGDPLTVAQILDRIRAAVGEDQLADYQVETKSNGGFVVHSQAATLRPFDVNGDGAVAPLDVLLVINHLNRDGAGALSDWPTVDEWRRDVSGDSFISPLDALQVINFISRQSSAAAPAEGESASSANALFGSPLAAGFLTVQFGADQDDEHSNSPIAEPSLNWFSELGRLPSFTPRSPAWPGNSGEALAETLESGECGCEELIDVLMPAWPRSFRDDL